MDTATPDETTALQKEEKEALSTLKFHEAQVVHAVRNMGEHLKAIRDTRCYRFLFASFEEYLEQRLQMTRRKADKIIATTEIQAHLAADSATTREIQAFADALNDSQAAAIKRLPPERRTEVVQKALETAKKTGQRVSRRLIDEAANEVIDVVSETVEEPQATDPPSPPDDLPPLPEAPPEFTDAPPSADPDPFENPFSDTLDAPKTVRSIECPHCRYVFPFPEDV